MVRVSRFTVSAKYEPESNLYTIKSKGAIDWSALLWFGGSTDVGLSRFHQKLVIELFRGILLKPPLLPVHSRSEPIK